MPAPKTVRSNKRLRALTNAAKLDGMEGPSWTGHEPDQYRGVFVPFPLFYEPRASRPGPPVNPPPTTRWASPGGRAHLEFPLVSTTPARVSAARLAGLPVFDPQGDQVGKVRDVVVVMRPGASSLVSQPRVVGLVVEVFGRRQMFAPMTRITSIDAGQVITTALLNMRRFAKRSTETLVLGQMLALKWHVGDTAAQ